MTQLHRKSYTASTGLVAGTCPWLTGRERLSAAISDMLDQEWTYAVGCTRLAVTVPSGDPKDPWTHLSPITVELMRAAIEAEVWRNP